MCQRKQLRDEPLHLNQKLTLQQNKPTAQWKKKGNLRAEEYVSQTPTSSSYNITSGGILEDFVEDSIERSRVEAERAFLNQQILETSQLVPLHETPSGTSKSGLDQVAVSHDQLYNSS